MAQLRRFYERIIADENASQQKRSKGLNCLREVLARLGESTPEVPEHFFEHPSGEEHVEENFPFQMLMHVEKLRQRPSVWLDIW